MSETIDLPRKVKESLQRHNDQMKRAQQAFNSYLKGVADALDIEDLNTLRYDPEKGALIRVSSSEKPTE